MGRELRKHELLIILLWPVAAAALSILFNAQFYLSLFLFYVVPSIFLSWSHPHLIKKSIIFALIFGIPVSFFVEYVMELTGSWVLIRMELPHFWIIEYVSLIQIVWGVIYGYFIVIFYEAFFDRSVAKVIYPRTKFLMLLGILLISSVTIAHFFFPSFLHIEYFYLKVGIVMALLPIVGIIIRSPSLVKKFIKIGSYFLYSSLLYEIIALRLNHWGFPNKEKFIGYVTIFGESFPIEELVFWMILTALAVLSYYEYFDDDGK